MTLVLDDGRPEERLQAVVNLVRELSSETDPQTMVLNFSRHARSIYRGDGFIAVSRRDLPAPRYRITRSSQWAKPVNPWTNKDALPLFDRGFLGDLLYSGEPRILKDFAVPADDPAYEYLKDIRSLVALPSYDGGQPINMSIQLGRDPACFDDLNLPAALMESNLFGRATKSLVLTNQLRQAYAEIEHEMRRVADIQRSLLPQALPKIPRLDIAVSYHTAARAGGDYYDFFELQDGRWGILIADASGHGTPAAVVMAMLRTILHGRELSAAAPAEVLAAANRHLCKQAHSADPSFITGFYAIFQPADGSLVYASAGHNPPLLVDAQIRVRELDEAQALPLGIDANAVYTEAVTHLRMGDTLLLYTDGITEAMNKSNEMYGRNRLLSCVREDVPNAQHIIDCVYYKLLGFTGDTQAEDDRTLLALRIRE